MGVILYTHDFNDTTTVAGADNFTVIVNTTASAVTTLASALRSTTTTTISKGCHNGSAPVCDCAAHSPNVTRATGLEERSLDALLYIVVVLLFYAFSIVVLMVKYIRRENKEAYLRQYFDEFVARERFQSAQARNQMCMQSIMDRQNHPLLTSATAQVRNDPSTDKMQDGKLVPNIPRGNGSIIVEAEQREEEEDRFELALCDLPEESPFMEKRINIK